MNERDLGKRMFPSKITGILHNATSLCVIDILTAQIAKYVIHDI